MSLSASQCKQEFQVCTAVQRWSWCNCWSDVWTICYALCPSEVLSYEWVGVAVSSVCVCHVLEGINCVRYMCMRCVSNTKAVAARCGAVAYYSMFRFNFVIVWTRGSRASVIQQLFIFVCTASLDPNRCYCECYAWSQRDMNAVPQNMQSVRRLCYSCVETTTSIACALSAT
jgi:hypothetical protein